MTLPAGRIHTENRKNCIGLLDDACIQYPLTDGVGITSTGGTGAGRVIVAVGADPGALGLRIV
jgi:hypothetical protein